MINVLKEWGVANSLSGCVDATKREVIRGGRCEWLQNVAVTTEYIYIYIA